MEVTELQCEILPYTECSMTMESATYKSHEMVPKTIKKKVCSEGMDIVQHTKMMPECRNVTKQNCISKFETDENGNQASDLAFSFIVLTISGTQNHTLVAFNCKLMIFMTKYL